MHLVDVTMYWAPHSGGVRRYLEAKRAWLARQPGWRHTLVTPGPWRCTPPQVPGLPVPGTGGYRMASGRGAARRLLLALQPDIIEFGDPWQLAWAALEAGAVRDVPVVGFYHGDLVAMASAWLERGRRAGLMHALAQAAQVLARAHVRRLYRRCDLVLAPSRHAAQAVQDILGHDAPAVGVQALGVDLQTFRPGQRDLRWRRRLGIGAHQHLLVYAGRYSREKNLPVLVEALRRLGPDHVLVTAGSGPAPPPALRGARVIDAGPLARCADLAGLLASADLFVHAGTQETFGLAVLEGLACGLPAVVPARGGLAELIDDSVGATVWPADAAQFAAAIAARLKQARAPLRSAARQRALRYDWDEVFATLARRYCMLCGTHGVLWPAHIPPVQKPRTP